MKSNNNRFLLLFAAQFFLILLYFLLLDFFYRKNSLLYQIDTVDVIGTLLVFSVIFGVSAWMVGALLSCFLVLAQRARPSFSLTIQKVFHFFIFAFFTHINFIFLKLWIQKVIPEQHFDRNARIISLITLVVLFLVFLALHYFVLRKPVKDRELQRTIGELLIPFALIIAGSVLLSIVIEHHPDKTAFFQKYGLTLFLVYYFLYWRKIHEALNARRLFIIPASIIFVVSIVGAMVVVVTAKRIPEVELATPLVQREKEGDVQNIIMVTFDGLSANRMSLYGNERPTTPVMDELAKTSYVFENMHAEADNTAQSISAMHTGMHYYGGELPQYGKAMAGGNVVGYIPRVLDRLGWESAYVWYGSNLHLGRGRIFTFVAPYNDMHDSFKESRYNDFFIRLTRYDVAFSPGWALASYVMYFSKYVSKFAWLFGNEQQGYTPPERVAGPGSDVYAWAFDYLDKKQPEHTFLWIHLWAPHQPYIRSGGPFLEDPGYTYAQALTEMAWNGPPLDPKYEPIAKKLRLMSEEYIAGADDAFGRFLSTLKNLGLYENTMLIVSTDHGQAFEKGDMYHLTGVMYEQTAQIPLLIHMPGQTKGRRIKTLAQHTDLMPTVLETLGVLVPEWMEGESLWKYIRQEKNKSIERVTFSQVIPEGLSFAKSNDISVPITFLVYKGDYKLIYRFHANRRFEEVEPPENEGTRRFYEHYPRIELFNLAVDPCEDYNIADEEIDVRDELVTLARQRIEKTRSIRAFR